ncbi:MAG: F0F1 ATP synthase subunit A [Bacillota bacterium]|nr:F0F1 ATP synthase subunit A [Bacillota bacterium]
MNSEELIGKMQFKPYDINLFGLKIPISDSIIVMWMIMVALVVLAIIFTRNLRMVPTGKQNVAESIVDFVNNFTKGSLGHHWKPFAPYFGTMILFLLFSNIVSIFNVLPTGKAIAEATGLSFLGKLPEIAPPTKDIDITATMAIMSIIIVLFASIKIKGVKGWLKTFVTPLPLMLPFKIMEYFVRPLSLCLRLFGNILAAFTIMELIYIAEPFLIPGIFSLYFDLFDGGLQAYIFVFLTSLYIAEAIE